MPLPTRCPPSIDPRPRRGRRRAALAVAAGALLAGFAVAQETRLEPLADGTELGTGPDGLIWSRCLVGAHWDGLHCVGEPARLDRLAAFQAAAARAHATGLDWRLPRTTELQLWQRRCARARDEAAHLCDETPTGWYWSSSSHVSGARSSPYDYGDIEHGLADATASHIAFLHGLAVESPTGAASAALKTERLYVRLVRAPAPSAPTR